MTVNDLKALRWMRKHTWTETHTHTEPRATKTNYHLKRCGSFQPLTSNRHRASNGGQVQSCETPAASLRNNTSVSLVLSSDVCLSFPLQFFQPLVLCFFVSFMTSSDSFHLLFSSFLPVFSSVFVLIRLTLCSLDLSLRFVWVSAASF